MRNEFCTLFDANYLPRGLVLYRSLAEICPDFRLRVFCMDEESKDLLDRLELPQLTTVSIHELERHDPELRAVKPTRNPVEYCWTATPSICLYCLEREPDLEMITYLDADLMFFQNPAPLFDEMASAATMVVPHRFSRGRSERTAGKYCVQFVPFRNDDRGFSVLRWWRERCLEWCYDRDEDGKFGDQTYLDEWPGRFQGVHVLRHPGGGVGPWNVDRFRLERRNGEVLVDGEPLVFYHYAALWFYSGRLTELPRRGVLSSYYGVAPEPGALVWGTPFSPSRETRELILEPYVRLLSAAIADIRRLDPGFSRGFVSLTLRDLGYQLARALVPRSARRAARRALPDQVGAMRRRRYKRAAARAHGGE